MLRLAGLAAYIKAGMGSFIVDTAAVSKAALASAGSVFLRRSTPKSTQPTSPASPPQTITGAFHNFDLEYLGPAKYAELQALRNGGAPSAPSNSGTAPPANPDSADSTVCDLDSTVTGHASIPVPVEEVSKSAEGTDTSMPSWCASAVPTAPYNSMMVTSDGRSVPAHEVARSIMESVFIKKGLTSPDSTDFKQSLPQLLNMLPRLDSSAQHACEVSSVQRDVDAEHSTAAPASEQAAAVLADSSAQPSAAGTAGGEPGEQWVGTLPPPLAVANAMAAAAENEAVAESLPVGSSQKLEDSPDAVEGLHTSPDAGISVPLVGLFVLHSTGEIKAVCTALWDSTVICTVLLENSGDTNQDAGLPGSLGEVAVDGIVSPSVC